MAEDLFPAKLKAWKVAKCKGNDKEKEREHLRKARKRELDKVGNEERIELMNADRMKETNLLLHLKGMFTTEILEELIGTLKNIEFVKDGEVEDVNSIGQLWKLLKSKTLINLGDYMMIRCHLGEQNRLKEEIAKIEDDILSKYAPPSPEDILGESIAMRTWGDFGDDGPSFPVSPLDDKNIIVRRKTSSVVSHTSEQELEVKGSLSKAPGPDGVRTSINETDGRRESIPEPSEGATCEVKGSSSKAPVSDGVHASVYETDQQNGQREERQRAESIPEHSEGTTGEVTGSLSTAPGPDVVHASVSETDQREEQQRAEPVPAPEGTCELKGSLSEALGSDVVHVSVSETDQREEQQRAESVPEHEGTTGEVKGSLSEAPGSDVVHASVSETDQREEQQRVESVPEHEGTTGVKGSLNEASVSDMVHASVHETDQQYGQREERQRAESIPEHEGATGEVKGSFSKPTGSDGVRPSVNETDQQSGQREERRRAESIPEHGGATGEVEGSFSKAPGSDGVHASLYERQRVESILEHREGALGKSDIQALLSYLDEKESRNYKTMENVIKGMQQNLDSNFDKFEILKASIAATDNRNRYLDEKVSHITSMLASRHEDCISRSQFESLQKDLDEKVTHITSMLASLHEACIRQNQHRRTEHGIESSTSQLCDDEYSEKRSQADSQADKNQRKKKGNSLTRFFSFGNAKDRKHKESK